MRIFFLGYVQYWWEGQHDFHLCQLNTKPRLGNDCWGMMGVVGEPASVWASVYKSLILTHFKSFRFHTQKPPSYLVASFRLFYTFRSQMFHTRVLVLFCEKRLERLKPFLLKQYPLYPEETWTLEHEWNLHSPPLPTLLCLADFPACSARPNTRATSTEGVSQG